MRAALTATEMKATGTVTATFEILERDEEGAFNALSWCLAQGMGAPRWQLEHAPPARPKTDGEIMLATVVGRALRLLNATTPADFHTALGALLDAAHSLEVHRS